MKIELKYEAMARQKMGLEVVEKSKMRKTNRKRIREIECETKCK